MPFLNFTLIKMAFQSWELLVSGRGLIAGVALMLVSVALHRHYFSDLSNVPGPFWASITRLWHVWYILNGKQNLHLKALHEKYGHFVRIAPNEVSVSHPDGSTLLLRAKLHKVGFGLLLETTTDYNRANGIR
ncbi:MAG: hypothetical protein CL912_02810 [Deltaproteobacteria bacterium]|nr:hypothetical protein [Deltaproteobacteria bacterium]|tara:strand:+ start:211 stop:606 length:396 start_codon:yes stop_codon:yes gene_type:complete